MRGLSLSQPWIWTMLHAGKHVENRDWQPAIEMIGQTIALHAAKSFDDNGLHALWKEKILTPDEFLKSHILGVATIDRIVTVDTTLAADQKRWFFGPFGWVLTHVRALPHPIPWDGALSLWYVPPIIEGLIQRQLDGEHVLGYLPAYTAALAVAGVESATEWAEKNPGKHLWFQYEKWPSCVACGKVKPSDFAKRPAKPCKGVVGISLRGERDA